MRCEMTSRLPVNESTRARLRAAQRAEAIALRAVQAADTVRSRARAALDSAERAVATAQAELVRTSGADRAALLLDVPVKVLPRVVRATEERPSEPA